MKFCTKCGAQNDDGLAFCSSCGASLNGETVVGEKKPFNVLALLGMIFGIASLVFCWSYGFGVLVGIAGLIMSIMSRKKDPANGMAKAGLICSIIGIALGVVLLIVCICSCVALVNSPYYY